MNTATRPTGRDLKAERVRAGLTQAQLGQLLGVSRGRITNVEAQTRPASTMAARIFGALGLGTEQ